MRFKILWVEDKPSAIEDIKEEVEKFLKEKDFYPDIEIIEDIENIETTLDEKINGDVDIIVTDNNLKDDGGVDIFNGADVLKKICDKGLLVDVLFYSTASFNEEDLIKKYRFVKVVGDKSKILEPLKKLIEKNIKRCEDPTFLRGYVLSRVVDLEIELNEIFEIYFRIGNTAKSHFHDFLMENRNFSLSGKQTTLSKIIAAHQSLLDGIVNKNQLNEISHDRNVLAHSKIDPDRPTRFIAMGSPKEFNRAELKKLLKKINDVRSQIRAFRDKLIEIRT